MYDELNNELYKTFTSQERNPRSKADYVFFRIILFMDHVVIAKNVATTNEDRPESLMVTLRACSTFSTAVSRIPPQVKSFV
jgi:hypothetical protein